MQVDGIDYYAANKTHFALTISSLSGIQMRNYTVCENKLEMNKLIPVIWCKTCQSYSSCSQLCLKKDYGFGMGHARSVNFQRFRRSKSQIVGFYLLRSVQIEIDANSEGVHS